MVSRPAGLVPLLLLLITAFAGCTGDDGPAEPATTDDQPIGVALAENPALEVPQPTWQVGDWFGHHIFFSPEDTEGLHINVMVVEEGGSSWTVATDDPEVAVFEAIYDIPITGAFSKTDLSTTGFGGPWKYYDFPLHDGKIWQGALNNGFGAPEDSLTFTATYNDGILTPEGRKPGFDIQGINADGVVQVVTDYIPDIQWYSKFEYFQPDNPEQYQFKTISMGFGANWTGTYYLDTATPLVGHQDIFAVDPETPGPPYAETTPYSSFTMSEEATYLSGYYFDFAFAAVRDMELVDPENNNHQFQVTDTGTGVGGFDFIDLPAIAGQWHIASAGAGVAHGAGIFLWEVVETVGQL